MTLHLKRSNQPKAKSWEERERKEAAEGKKTSRQRAIEKAKAAKPIPEQSFLPLPDEQPCRKRGCREDPCFEHCRDPKAVKYKHQISLARAGWSKGRGDGTFEVFCCLCGEVGTVIVDPNDLPVEWTG